MLKIEIQTNADFTPSGKRTARVVQTTRGTQLRFYVSGRMYRQLPATEKNIEMSKEWISARTA